MPDSKWIPLQGQDARDQEAEYTGAGRRLRGWGREETLEPAEPPNISWIDPNTGKLQESKARAWNATRSVTFTRLFYQGVEPPAARPVIQYCNRCEGHVDTLVEAKTLGALGVPYPRAHVEAGEYGHRNGNLYLRYQVRGTILRRISQVEIELQEGGSIESENDVSVRWERKTIDRVEQGPHVHWLDNMQAKDCEHRLGGDAFGYRGSDLGHELLAVLRETGLGDASTLLNDGEAIAEISSFAATLANPTFSIVMPESPESDSSLQLELVSLSDTGKPRIHGRLTVVRHESGFMTVAEWMPRLGSG